MSGLLAHRFEAIAPRTLLDSFLDEIDGSCAKADRLISEVGTTEVPNKNKIER